MTARPQDVALLPLPASSWQLLHDDAAGTEIAPPTPLWNADKMAAYARANVTAALASAQAREEEFRKEVERLTGVVRGMANQIADTRHRAERLEEALRHALNQNEHDMVLTGDEIRDARALLSTNAATQTGERK